ncbi:MAS20 protein import receptor-domain-containing protein [Gamsiella multidivaricata]|uniref:MAS20 protein import receptor-domain-containing protein n=1 Tax=Gamsiella multidivaricata TaxID=101098 RepID=UPI00221F12E3|nr:MAS20 protein import receptor-domain-containing protein [Gamsiella multidivaricata]KAI7819853.1 MAS20 protein import receptor-domain-containing protein [Gamsiella multidivaricata]
MKTSTIVAATVGVLAVATVGYAIYFDSKRRNDPEFRRKLKKERKRTQKLAAEEAKKLSNKSAQTVEEALASISDEDFPTSMEEREKFCMEQLSAGEALFTQGPTKFGQAAICFYKALKVYPAPAELVMVYQKTIPPEVFTLVMGMLSKDVQSKQEKYYTVFPPEEMNVKVEEKPEGVAADGQKVTRRGLVATKSFGAGQTVYSEAPVISSLEPSLEGKDFCHYCLKQIVDEASKVPCSKCTQVVFCTEDCRKSAAQEFHDILCTKDSEDASSPERSLREYTKTTRNLVPEMLAKFLVKMVHEESLNSGAEYNSFDHMERLRYLEITATAEEEKEMELLKVALGSNIPGIDEFITEERYLLMKGRLLYNLYGVSTSLNVDHDVEPLPERHRSVRDAPITGGGFYRVTSYLMHSCEPNAKIVFSENDHKVSIVTTREVMAGEELLVGYIKNDDLSTESRRLELFTKYRFRCMCPLCETTD